MTMRMLNSQLEICREPVDTGKLPLHFIACNEYLHIIMFFLSVFKKRLATRWVDFEGCWQRSASARVHLPLPSQCLCIKKGAEKHSESLASSLLPYPLVRGITSKNFSLFIVKKTNLL